MTARDRVAVWLVRFRRWLYWQLQALPGRLYRGLGTLLRWLYWQLRAWFAGRSWIGKTLAVALALCALGYLADTIGANGVGRDLWQAGILVASVLATALVIRLIFTKHAGRPW